MDKLRAMTTFVRIVEAGSLTGAGERLGSSLTAVVRSLAGLEEHLGLRLLNRTTRRISLTDEGMDYLAHCRRLLAEIEEAEASLSRRRGTPSGTIRLTAPVMFGRMHIAEPVAGFLQAHPTVQVEMTLLDRVVDLLEEGLDLAVRIGVPAESSLIAVHLGTTRRMLCAAPAYLAVRGRPLHPSDLTAHGCIRTTAGFTGTDWGFQEAGRPVRVPVQGQLSCNQLEVARDACERGLGCGLFLEYQVRPLLAQGRLIPLLEEFEAPPLPVNLLYLHARLLSLRVRTFVDWMVPRLRHRLAPAVPSPAR